MAKRELWELQCMQGSPLSVKVRMTENRIREWVQEYGEDGVYVSFSGGKDSTVLLHIVRNLYPNIKAVYVDTGLEYPEIKEFVKTFDNVEIIRPKLTFKQVAEKYGYPFISKPVSNVVRLARENIKAGKENTNRVKQIRGEFKNYDGGKSQFNYEKYKFLLDAPFKISEKCCDVMKKSPIKAYEKKTGRHPFIGQLTQESVKRRNAWLKTGCNGFELENPQSNPMAFWLEQDVLSYIRINNLPIASVYGDVVYVDEDGMEYTEPTFSESMKLKTTGCTRTGCMFCGFGCHLNQDDRYTSMKKTHPAIYDYVFKPESEGGLGYKEKIDWLNENGKLKIKY